MKKLICHCGAVEAEINLDGDLAKVIKCNCSICKRKSATMGMVKNEDFKITKIFFIWYLIKLSLVEVIHKHTKCSFDVHVLIHF